LPTYGAEEGLNDGSGLWLLAGLGHLVTLPRAAVTIYMGCVAIGPGAIGLLIARGRLTEPANDVVALCRDTVILAACLTAAISPHYTWYFAWLALPPVVAPIPAILWLSVSPVVLYLDPFNDRFFWPGIVYLPAAGLTLFSLWKRHAPRSVVISASEGRSK
jgi:alpha-1,6-mannosyltransferase